MSGISGREWVLIILLVIAIGVAMYFAVKGPSIPTLDDLLVDRGTYTMQMIDDTENAGKVTVVSSTGGGNTLEAELGDTVIWKNDSNTTVSIHFNQIEILFGVDTFQLAPGESRSLVILADAFVGRPGYEHKVLVDEEVARPGSTIIVCPPPPLNCN